MKLKNLSASVTLIALFLYGLGFSSKSSYGLEDQLLLVKPQNVNAQLILPMSQNRIGWSKVSKNRWRSETGISLNLYQKDIYANIPFARFWDTENALEAQLLLARASPGDEIYVSNYFRRSGSAWLFYQYAAQPKCPGLIGDCPSSLYVIHYLHRPQNDWVIDLLTSHAKGFILGQRVQDRYIYEITDGPYDPIFEGRFKYKRNSYWFSATGVQPSRQLSTPEMRYNTFQSINDLLKSLVLAKD
jgi:hypothetical protein